MLWFSFKKKQQILTISDEAINRIEEESIKIGKPQVLSLEIKRNKEGLGSVAVGFSQKKTSETGFIQWVNKADESLLSRGELKFENGNFYFYPNVDLEWKRTPRPTIHKLIANYEFSQETIYLESENFFRLRPILNDCFQREGVLSLYFKGYLCQLEIPTFNKDKEERISEVFLTYLSSLYLNPWKE